MRASLGWIRQFHRPPAAEAQHSHKLDEHRPPLLVFPHAGSGASGYREISRALSTDFNVVVFQYPGRQDRVREPACETIQDFAAGAFTEFQQSPLSRQQLTLFGHSVGSMIAFEFARLAEAAGLTVELLCVSAAVAPSLSAGKPPCPTEDEQVLDYMTKLRGTNGSVLESMELLRMALPVLRADYAAFNRYACADDVLVQARVLALGGSTDPIVTSEELDAWARHTSGASSTRLFHGDHFYWQDRVDEVAEALIAESRRTADQAVTT